MRSVYYNFTWIHYQKGNYYSNWQFYSFSISQLIKERKTSKSQMSTVNTNISYIQTHDRIYYHSYIFKQRRESFTLPLRNASRCFIVLYCLALHVYACSEVQHNRALANTVLKVRISATQERRMCTMQTQFDQKLKAW